MRFALARLLPRYFITATEIKLKQTPRETFPSLESTICPLFFGVVPCYGRLGRLPLNEDCRWKFQVL